MIRAYLNVGTVHLRSKEDKVDYVVYKKASLTEVIIPHFLKYPLENIKTIDLDIFIAVLTQPLSKPHQCPPERQNQAWG